MDYLDAVRPIFSHVAHATAAAPGLAPGLSHPQTLQVEVERLIARARSLRGLANVDRFDAAWLALCSWLDETLPGDATLVRHYFGADGADAFFASLDRLLDPPGFERFDADRLAVLEVYATALDLGFQGRCRSDPTLLARYRRDCREELTAAAADVSAVAATLTEPRPPRRRGMPLALKLLLWLAPVAATLALYAYYRTLLAELYALALG